MRNKMRREITNAINKGYRVKYPGYVIRIKGEECERGDRLVTVDRVTERERLMTRCRNKIGRREGVSWKRGVRYLHLKIGFKSCTNMSRAIVYSSVQ